MSWLSWSTVARRTVLMPLAAVLIVAGAGTIYYLFYSPSRLIAVTIPEGLRKEEIAVILTKKLGWTKDQTQEWLTVDTTKNADFTEGVYFPDTYLIPKNETPARAARRLQANFESKFASYANQALLHNVKWTTALTIASLIQREAAPNQADRQLVSGIIWNRLDKKMKLEIDSTVQYARGDKGAGYWAPIKPADKKIDSPYNTYMYAGLPPHPIANPGLNAIAAALDPATTTCLYYLHDAKGRIHCESTYSGQLKNIDIYY